MNELRDDFKQALQTYNKKQLTAAFNLACQNGDLALVKYLLTSPELKEHVNIHAKDDHGFRWACQNGHIEIVQYLLTSPDLNDHADIHADDDGGFRWACEHGHLEVVKYLLTSPELSEHADNDSGFIWAYQNGHIDVVHYILTSPELNKYTNVHHRYYRAFQTACLNGNQELGLHLLTAPEFKDYASWTNMNDILIYMYSRKHYKAIKVLLTASVNAYLDFESTNYTLGWFLSLPYHPGHEDVIEGMTLMLKKHNYFTYLDYLPDIKKYSVKVKDKDWYKRITEDIMDDIIHDTPIIF